MSPSENSPFWTFSLAFYRQPGVAEACLRLQDESGVDVNVLLFLLWQASKGWELSPAEVGELDQHVAAWRQMTVIPLRSVRRALKSPPAMLTPDAGEGYRTRIKAVELEAERLQQRAMFEWSENSRPGQAASSIHQAAAANVAAYENVLETSLLSSAASDILKALDTMCMPNQVV